MSNPFKNLPAPPEGWARPGLELFDTAAWHEVVTANSYKLGSDMSNFRVVDVGAHIGAFTWACLERGAVEIVAIEADPRNYAHLVSNLSTHPRRDHVQTFNRAAWASDEPPKVLRMSSYPDDRPGMNTGGGSVATVIDGALMQDVLAQPFANLVSGLDHIDLLKLDCEGSEFAILYTSESVLSKTDNLVAEVHPNIQFRDRFCTVQALQEYLTSLGFTCGWSFQHIPHTPILWAAKTLKR